MSQAHQVESTQTTLATLTVRNLDGDVVRRLRIRAAEHGRSAEAEHRDILRHALLASIERQVGRGARHATLSRISPTDDRAWIVFRQGASSRCTNGKNANANRARRKRLIVAIGVDASVGLKWALQETDSYLSEALIRYETDLLVPDLWLNEATNRGGSADSAANVDTPRRAYIP